MIGPKTHSETLEMLWDLGFPQSLKKNKVLKAFKRLLITALNLKKAATICLTK